MASNTLNDWTSGQTITPSVPNNIHQALNGDLVGRGATGIPTAGQNLGTVAIPWGTVRADNLIIAGSAVDTSSIVSSPNRVVSGAVRSTSGSNLPQFIIPSGAGLSADLDATPTNLVVVINGATVTFIADATKSSLTAAPSSQNTALVNDVDAADQFDTKYWGEQNHRKVITMDTVGTEISSLVGKWAAFKMSGVTDEYFYAYVKSATELAYCKRGFFYGASLSPVKPTAFSNNDTITLMKLSWWFVENDATNIDITYTNPVWSFTAPSAPVTGDYWYDLGNNQWLRYNGASFDIINRTFIGWTIQDTTNCVAARCEDFYASFKADNTLKVDKFTTEIARAVETNAVVNVAGVTLEFGHDLPNWNITTDLAASTDMFDGTEQSSRLYWLYLKQNGDTVISDIAPYIRSELKGRYHRYNTWRCVGWMYNDASSDVQGAACWNYDAGLFSASTGNGQGAVFTQTRRWTTVQKNTLSGLEYVDSANNGGRFTALVDGTVSAWGTDYNGASSSFWGWLHNPVIPAEDATDRTLDPRNIYTFSPTGGPQPVELTSALKVGDIVVSQSDGGAGTNGSAQVDVIFRWVPGKDV